MKYYVWTIGCQMNVADSRSLAANLEALGIERTVRAEDADVIVVNTCVVRQQAEDRAIGRLTSLVPIKRSRPETIIAVMGCLVGPRPRARLLEQFPYVDVFMPPSDARPLLALLESRLATRRDTDGDARAHVEGERAVAVLPAHERHRLVSAHVPIVLGCSLACAYCVIPSRRGRERSRPPDDIAAEARRLVDQGVREITLLGQIVDRYGLDRGEADALPDLLRHLSGIEGLHRLRFLTSHPLYVTEALIDAVATLPNVMEQFEVPVQSGSDRVLARMRRGYDVAAYRRVVDAIRRRIPHAAVHTDIIVGFCGETDAEFQATCDLIADLRLDKVHIARYSERPGTYAALRLVDDVPDDIKERRRAHLDATQALIAAQANARLLGATVEVLVDGRDGSRWRGRTRANKVVFFEDERPLAGRVVDVRVEWAGPWSLVGRAGPARPDHD